MVRVLVCGGRDYSDEARVYQVLDAAVDRLQLSEIIHGGASGADILAGHWARSRGIRCRVFKADWDTHGLKAGPLRNEQMLVQGRPDIVIAFPGGAGTADIVRRAEAAHLRVIRA